MLLYVCIVIFVGLCLVLKAEASIRNSPNKSKKERFMLRVVIGVYILIILSAPLIPEYGLYSLRDTKTAFFIFPAMLMLFVCAPLNIVLAISIEKKAFLAGQKSKRRWVRVWLWFVYLPCCTILNAVYPLRNSLSCHGISLNLAIDVVYIGLSILVSTALAQSVFPFAERSDYEMEFEGDSVGG